MLTEIKNVDDSCYLHLLVTFSFTASGWNIGKKSNMTQNVFILPIYVLHLFKVAGNSLTKINSRLHPELPFFLDCNPIDLNKINIYCKAMTIIS